MGLLSYKINNSYAYFTNSVTGSKTIEMTYTKPNLDTSGANVPILSDNMIPVYYDESGDVWRKADSTNSNKNYKWYDYDNKMWANAVTVSSLYYSVSNGEKQVLIESEIGLYYNEEKRSFSRELVGYVKNGNKTTTNYCCCSKSKPNLNVTDGTYTLTGSYRSLGSVKDYYCSLVLSSTVSFGDSCTTEVKGVSYVAVSYDKSGSFPEQGNNYYVLSGTNYSASESSTYVAKDYKISKDYSLNSKTGKYTLTNPESKTYSSDYVNYYMCSDKKSTTCDTMYQIKQVDDDTKTITKVKEFLSEKRNDKTISDYNVGDIISIDDINTMWVWIPRYTYTYFSSSTPVEINIKFEEGTNSSGTISCTDTAAGTSSTSETCTDSTNGSLKVGTSTYTHPAFWWDKDDDSVRESGEELTGIWVGKFEISNGYKIIPNITSLRSKDVSIFFTNMYNMRNSGNDYGFSTNDETHMIKNMEWGAVAYLSHSKYGRCTDGTCIETTINNCSSFITGIGGDSTGASSSSVSCTTAANKYNGAKGMLASTTGNIYGIYDMSGGAHEYVMGDLVSPTGVMMSGYSSSKYSSGDNSGFTGYLEYQGGSYSGKTFPNKRYYDKYSYGTTETGYTRGKLGDATKEMGPSSYWSWYSTYASFPYSGYTWFSRGSYYNNGSRSILFAFYYKYGEADLNYSSRAVISNLN
ncbi:MAG: hypothetical protein Q4C29_01945 [bacterium]|nr:hypothetical protein [bacterium]